MVISAQLKLGVNSDAVPFSVGSVMEPSGSPPDERDTLMLTGQTFAVTGLASGIGAATAAALAEAGATVIGVDRNRAEDWAGQQVQVDLSRPRGVREAAGALPEGLDGLVNIAGVPGTAPWRLVLSVNTLGLRDLSRAVVPKIRTGGVVVNLASGVGDSWRENIDAVRRFTGAADWEQALASVEADPEIIRNSYRFSKECVRWLTLQAAAEHLGRVRFTSVSPGPVDTPILDDFRRDHGPEKVAGALALVGRPASPQDVARVVRFLVGPEAHWVNGTDLAVDGGLSAHRTVQSVRV